MCAEKSKKPIPLKLERVTKRYKTHFWQRAAVSVDDLSLSIEPGSVLGLLGHNGAGKTTTIKLALGLIFPDSGDVRLFGDAASKPAARARVGYLPEAPYFPEDLTGRELVELSARLYGMDRATRRRRAGEMLERLGLGRAADRKIRKYSKGMVQRAGLARALVTEPEFVILDEPMSGLDPVGRREVRDLILALRKAGTTVLFASHVLSDAEMLCDHVAILRNGRLIRQIEMARLSRERRTKHWEVEVSGGEVVPDAEVISVRGNERLLRFPASLDSETIIARLQNAGVTLLSLAPQRQNLEDLFMESFERAEDLDASSHDSTVSRETTSPGNDTEEKKEEVVA